MHDHRNDSSQALSPIRLTQQVKAGGCASKLAPGSLRTVLDALPLQTDPNLLVGFDQSDDAGIYRLGQNMALVQTVDFFTPMVDAPYTFGQIAAANSLSDVYAMGGQPLTALAVVCFPQDGDMEVLGEVMRGGLSKLVEANCTLIGGHSVRDTEMKFGYAITGLIDPAHIFTNAGARPGDVLILTKPIGTGVITTALKQDKAQTLWVNGAVRWMTTLNKITAAIVAEHTGVHAMTDITGFGLMGHGREMAIGSGVTLEIETEEVPLLEGALDAVALGTIPAGLLANRDYAECVVSDALTSRIREDVRTLMYDPQTSGGLLISADAETAAVLLASFRDAPIPAKAIGRVLAGKPAIVLR
ncbi:selenide, water dikinase SelD [Alloacidobacterium sp.]|uniref:selenide, water dikinase SelD n=1 Tax=Alloacidobacterium sp. TaxID=2951999 RepID=UPI002D552399|nr:selenide, water dikinase SelD [Alloacidobacterium sp.]HYK37861.1 selenide, water dikinase SelD [Alloacidobacterium sp.]